MQPEREEQQPSQGQRERPEPLVPEPELGPEKQGQHHHQEGRLTYYHRHVVPW